MIDDIVIDAETESSETIDLGAYAYNNHPSTDTLCFSWRPLHEPPGNERIWFPGKRVNPAFLVWLLTGSRGQNPPVFVPGDFDLPRELAKAIGDGAHFHAHNAFFEQCWWKLVCVKKYGWPDIPADHWHCSAAQSAYHGYSQSLERACLGVGTKIAKDTVGGDLMKKMSPVEKRTKKVVANWDLNLFRLGQYCKVDVASEADLILSLPPLPETEQEIWLLDQQINFRGLPLDRELVEAGAASSDLLQKYARKRLPELTDGAVTKPGEVQKIKKWVEESVQEKIPNLQAGTVDQLINSGRISPEIAEVLQIRQDAGTAAIKKFAKEAAAIKYSRDARFRGGFVYYGAHTGRWTGKIVQPTNMPRAHFNNESETEAGIVAIKSRSLKTMEAVDHISMERAKKAAKEKGQVFEAWRPTATNTLTKCVRASITASDEKVFVAADWAGIELRVLTWFAKDEEGLKRIVEKGSSQLYLDMADAVFGRPIKKSDTFEYTVGKAGRLGCGYGMGPYTKEKSADGAWIAALDEFGRPFGGFVEYARNYGIEITPATLELADKVVDTYREENQKVKKLWDRCHKAAVSVVREGFPAEVNGARFSVFGKGKQRTLKLTLPSGRDLFYPRISIEERKGRESLSYWGDKNKKWVKIHLYGGLIVENIVQSMSRDILTPSMLKVAEEFDIVSHCYDEIVTEVPVDKADETVIIMNRIMCEPLPWAKGLPLETEIWKGKRYRK